MRSYELVIITRPDLDDESFDAVVEKVKTLLTVDGAEVTSVDKWGRRNLAYPINKLTEGQYVLMNMQLQPQRIIEVERELHLDEQIIRHLIVRVEA